MRKDFPWTRIPGYRAVQVTAAIAAAALLRAMSGPVGHLGATLPHHGQATSMVLEAFLTFFLVAVILGTAAGHKLIGHNAALASAGVIALDDLFAAPISGASMNPARSLGPDLLAGTMSTYWVYLAGPVIGAPAAVVLAAALHGGSNRNERHAAVGA